MDLFDKYPIFYREIDTEWQRGTANRMTILRLDGPNFGLSMSGWLNGDKIFIESCIEFKGFKDITCSEMIKKSYTNSNSWIETEIINEEYFNLALKSLVDRECKVCPKNKIK